MTPWVNKSSDVQKDAKIIFGHFVKQRDMQGVFPEEKLKYVTVLREPARRWVSQYNFELALNKYPNIKKMSFWEYFNKKNNANYMINFLCSQFFEIKFSSDEEKLNFVIDELKSFEYVACLENFPPFLDWLTNELNIPKLKKSYNVSKSREVDNFEPTNEDLNKLRELCQLDYQLYNYFLTRD
jgi:hypothetical protein